MEALEDAIRTIRTGGVVAMPTETVYGLAADATLVAAIARIYALKQRPSFDPLIVHVDGPEGARRVARFGREARILMERFWPGPLTLVLARRPGIPELVSSGLSTVGVRAPDHPLAQALIHGADRPLAAPSANLFGRISPTTAEHVREQFPDATFPILDGGPCRVGVESTVLRLDGGAVILRPGAVTSDQLSEVLGRVVPFADSEQRARSLPRQAPGMLASHYAPTKPLRLRLADEAWSTMPTVGKLAFTGEDIADDVGPLQILSPTGDLAEAAGRLFAALRHLEAGSCEFIMAELVPDLGIGRAINDRLRRAAGLG